MEDQTYSGPTCNSVCLSEGHQLLNSRLMAPDHLPLVPSIPIRVEPQGMPTYWASERVEALETK